MTSVVTTPLTRPGRGRGLLDVFRRRYLLTLLVRKDVQIRYRGSVLGWFWSYIKPALQFLVYYMAMGVVLRANASMPNFAVYLFSGLIVINFFNEAFGNGTRSIVDNAALVKKIYLPRELFPTSSVIIAFVNFLPQLAVLLVVCLFLGWRPSFMELAALALGLVIITILSTGLGLLFSSVNVSLRDAQSLVEMILLFTTWLSPVLYNMSLVSSIASPGVLLLYNLNPITGAVQLFHWGIWFPTTARDAEAQMLLGDGILRYGLVALLVALVFLALGQWVFRRFEKNFAQDL